MELFSEWITTILKNGTWTRNGNCPVILETWESKGESPDEGIIPLDDDVNTEDGTASDGSIIFEITPGTLLMWSDNKTSRYNILEDIKDIIKAANANGTAHAIILGYLPKTFIDKKGFEMRIQRTV